MEGEAQEYKAMEFKVEKEEELPEPVSPTGQYFNSSVLSIFILAVLESEVPIDDSITMTLLKDVFLPINPRFSSIMVTDKNGDKQWKKFEVKLTNHVDIPIFPNRLSYDTYFNDYVSKVMNTISDFGWSLLKSSFVEDHRYALGMKESSLSQL